MHSCWKFQKRIPKVKTRAIIRAYCLPRWLPPDVTAGGVCLHDDGLPHPYPPSVDRQHLWKHYLPAISLAGGKTHVVTLHHVLTDACCEMTSLIKYSELFFSMETFFDSKWTLPWQRGHLLALQVESILGSEGDKEMVWWAIVSWSVTKETTWKSHLTICHLKVGTRRCCFFNVFKRRGERHSFIS